MNKKVKQILAIIGIIIIAALYITTLLLAILGNEQTDKWFTVSIAATILVPLLMWIYSWLYKLLKRDGKDNSPK